MLARGTSLPLSFKWGFVGMMAMKMPVSVTSFALNEYRKEFACCVTREGEREILLISQWKKRVLK